ncbi:uncharacterized protein LOC131841693 [Achroia grisella]|uniref:uncharacterized protein LOC131841693 n=1 Tax=Achroia grisella TaxID=688607 RepID=UPI0027D2D10A|nr:uncharacterized protein LOC131841693 [Achroia grisella]
MLSLAFLFAVIMPLNGIYGNTQNLDVGTLMEILQTQQQLQQRERDRRSSSDSSESSDKEDNRRDILRSGEIVGLIEEAANEKERMRKYKQQNYDNMEIKNIIKLLNKQYGENTGNSFPTQQILEEVLSQNADVIKQKNKKVISKHALKPNNLLESFNYKNRGDGSLERLDQYSKIYVILNPQAIKKSKNKNKLTNLISQIVSLSTMAERNEDRYKGLSVNNNSIARRSRRDSKEMYSSKKSMEDDYKPKRSWNDRGGSGGQGGRTAIPYIRQRGDIYERDN